MKKHINVLSDLIDNNEQKQIVAEVLGEDYTVEKNVLDHILNEDQEQKEIDINTLGIEKKESIMSSNERERGFQEDIGKKKEVLREQIVGLLQDREDTLTKPQSKTLKTRTIDQRINDLPEDKRNVIHAFIERIEKEGLKKAIQELNKHNDPNVSDSVHDFLYNRGHENTL